MTQIPPQLAEIQGPSDGVLLRRFVQDADEVAFGQIVQRHAALVMSVCRRVVGQTADVDDAFQATFYALSQRPESIRECRSLTGWLYSVAWRTSVRLVRLRKKSKMETLPDQLPVSEPDPLDRIAEANDLAALDEELNQLPEKYRHVLVMSYFSHQTNQEIADQLNESKGAVDGRIRDARRMLRVRLARRGVEIGALMVAGALAQSASAAVSPQLISTTLQFAKLSSGFSSAASVTGVDLSQMQVLSSTGTTVMGIKAGTAIATGLLMLSGALGFSQLLARQDPVEGGDGGAAVVTATAGEDQPVPKEETVAGEVSASATPQSEATAAGTSNAGAGSIAGGFGSGAGFGSALGSGDGFGMGAGGVGMSAGPGESGGDMAAGPSGAGMMSGGGMSGTGAARSTRSGAIAEFSRAGTRKVQQQLHEMMYSTKLPATMDFPNSSLRDIFEQLETVMNEKSPVKLRFMLDDTDPDIGTDPEYLTNTQVTGLFLSADSMTLASALDVILNKVHDQELTWIVENEMVIITTESSAESEDRAFLRSYDVKTLRPMFEEMALAVPMVPDTTEAASMGGGGFGGGMGGGGGMFMVPQASPAAMSGPRAESGSGVNPSGTAVTSLQQMGGGGAGMTLGGGMPGTEDQPGGMGMGGMAGGDSAESPMMKNTWQRCLINEIQSLTTPPCSWIVNGESIGTMSVVGDRLIVQQNRKGHEKVVEVLEELELAVESP